MVIVIKVRVRIIMIGCRAVIKVDRRIRWHYTTTILRLRIGARLTTYQNCKFHNFARTISRHADGISRYSVPPSAGPLLPLVQGWGWRLGLEFRVIVLRSELVLGESGLGFRLGLMVSISS